MYEYRHEPAMDEKHFPINGKQVLAILKCNPAYNQPEVFIVGYIINYRYKCVDDITYTQYEPLELHLFNDLRMFVEYVAKTFWGYKPIHYFPLSQTNDTDPRSLTYYY